MSTGLVIYRSSRWCAMCWSPLWLKI